MLLTWTVRAGNFSGWLSPGDCDPCGARVVVVQRALRKYPRIAGFFWEHAARTLKPDTPTREGLW